MSEIITLTMDRNARERRMRNRWRKTSSILFYVGLSLISLAVLAPLAWSLTTSVYGARATTGGDPGFGLENYVRLVRFGEGLLTYFMNSTIVTLVAVVGTLFVTVLGGYAFSRFSFPGKNILFLTALAILMVPHPTILVPLYTMLGAVGMRNSLVAVALVLVMFQLPFGLFMMRNAFDSVPRELEEAALLDGNSSFGALRRVLLPAVTPAMVTVGMFAFLAAWNEFLTPLILLTRGNAYTLSVALVSLRSGEMGTIDLGALQAGIVVTAIPCLLVFTLLQRYYVRGFTTGAVRG